MAKKSASIVKHKTWPFLRPHDVVDIVAPGYASPEEQVKDGVEYLKKWQLTGRVPKGLIQKHFLHANSDEKRFQHLKAAIQDPESRVIWCTRGGYGSNRLLPMLEKLSPPSQPKILVGLSDITSLHCFFTQKWGWSTLHACVLDRLGQNKLPPRLEKELKDVLFGQVSEVQFKKLKPLNDQARQVKSLKAKIVGGNLAVLQTTLGTPYQIQARGAFLFIEDIGERGYRIDRMLEHMRQAGVFRGCKGILLGQFIGGDEPGTKKNNFKKVFARWAQDLEIPMWSGIEAGHDVVQRALPLNTPCVLQADGLKYTLTVKTGGVTPR